MPDRIKQFQDHAVTYVETTYPNDDVECDVYSFNDDAARDLAIIQVKPNGRTPFQRVLDGEETIQGYVSGTGTFYHNDNAFEFPSATLTGISVGIGQTMIWRAGAGGLVYYEICTPPYSDGRFEEIILDDTKSVAL